jgi:hypothetical protein
MVKMGRGSCKIWMGGRTDHHAFDWLVFCHICKG